MAKVKLGKPKTNLAALVDLLATLHKYVLRQADVPEQTPYEYRLAGRIRKALVVIERGNC